MFEFCHILGVWNPYKLRNNVLNLKIFHRKFVIGLVGYRSGPKPPLCLELKGIGSNWKANCHATTKMVHAKKGSNFTSKVIAIVFWNALCDAIGRDFSKKWSPFFSGWNIPRFATICRNSPRVWIAKVLWSGLINYDLNKNLRHDPLSTTFIMDIYPKCQEWDILV